MIKLRLFLWPIIVVSLMLFVGCVTAKKKTTEEWQPVKAEEVFVHTVQWSNESLAMLSTWYTGSESNRQLLADANPNVVANHLQIGDRVFIPSTLKKTSRQMTHDFALSFKESVGAGSSEKGTYRKGQGRVVILSPKPSKVRRRATSNSESADKDDEFDFFGRK